VTQISPTSAAAVSVAASYLIGSIPFGYLIARGVQGIDIRTVGSGNLGATNVGRVLGRRYFWIVLALDLLKGLLPTIGFPGLVGRLAGEVPVDLPVLVGLAAILGHTFPVYLRFRGGKGVATSLGVVLALDPISCAVAVLVFGVALAISRYMSLASLAGGVGFMAAHFVLDRAPFSREHIAMSLFSIAVVGLLVVRHRSNLARIRAGTENRVNLGRSSKRDDDKPRDEGPPGSPPDGPSTPRSGRIGLFLAIGLAVLSLIVVTGIWLAHNAARSIEAVAGPWALKETDRLTTGQQRVDRVAFATGGDCLAGICPRYNRLLIYRVDAVKKLRPIAETQLEGRPVGVVSLGTRFAVLQRPAGDAKHLEPGWWEVFDREGKRVGSRILAGFYPDDLAASPDGRLVFVLCSGRSEGDEKKPLATLDVLDLDPETAASRLLGRVNFDASDDPERVTLSASSRYAAVLLAKSKRTAAVDVSDPTAPRLIGRTPAALTKAPYVSTSEDADWIMMPAGSEGNTIVLESPHTAATSRGAASQPGVMHPDYLVTTRENESALEILQMKPQHEVGRFPLLGPFNLGHTRPTGLAYSPERGIIAVATRTGSIHVVEMRVR
jgi:acyl-phosphate glycerol 3-phosphate acyltransferase